MPKFNQKPEQVLPGYRYLVFGKFAEDKGIQAAISYLNSHLEQICSYYHLPAEEYIISERSSKSFLLDYLFDLHDLGTLAGRKLSYLDKFLKEIFIENGFRDPKKLGNFSSGDNNSEICTYKNIYGCKPLVAKNRSEDNTILFSAVNFCPFQEKGLVSALAFLHLPNSLLNYRTNLYQDIKGQFLDTQHKLLHDCSTAEKVTFFSGSLTGEMAKKKIQSAGEYSHTKPKPGEYCLVKNK
ncbi:MAG: hypothetical protein ABIA37_01135 [Candidatus Woesearchaeota archaeon]